MIQYKVLAILALIAAIYGGGYLHGKGNAEAKQDKIELKTVKKGIIETNKDIKTNQAAAVIVETKIKYVDRVVYETITQTIDSDCDVDQLNGLLNLAISAVNDTMQLQPE